MIRCAVHHADIGLCGCDADEQYRQAQANRPPPADPHAGHHARIIRAIAELEAAVEQAKQHGVDPLHYRERLKALGDIGS